MTQGNTAAMFESLANLAALAEATVGYRKILIDGGCPPELADELTRDYHNTLMVASRNGLEAAAAKERRR